jgi:hypothetical protein
VDDPISRLGIDNQRNSYNWEHEFGIFSRELCRPGDSALVYFCGPVREDQTADLGHGFRVTLADVRRVIEGVEDLTIEILADSPANLCYPMSRDGRLQAAESESQAAAHVAENESAVCSSRGPSKDQGKSSGGVIKRRARPAASSAKWKMPRR